jgi:hypothetical protein
MPSWLEDRVQAGPSPPVPGTRDNGGSYEEISNRPVLSGIVIHDPSVSYRRTLAGSWRAELEGASFHYSVDIVATLLGTRNFPGIYALTISWRKSL